jgi:hypothetical protein
MPVLRNFVRATNLSLLWACLAVGLCTPAVLANEGVAGRFSGSWCSQSSGHQGRMCANLRQTDACTYRARFTGTFLGIVPFAYSVPMTVTGQSPDGAVWLSSRSRLPLFGEFTTQARVDSAGMSATYWSRRDQGTFEMPRR